MKILLLTDRMDHGGAETHIAQLALGLRRMGEEVMLLSSGGSLADRLEAAGVPQIRLPLCTHDPMRLFFLRQRIKRLIKVEKFDILHAHARLPAFLLRGLGGHGSARIVTAHARFRRTLPLWLASYWGERTVAVSEDLRSYLAKEYGVPAERISVIPNGIDCARFAPPIPDPRQEDPADGGVRICFVSRLDADCSKVAALLCTLAPRLESLFPCLEITVAGGGSEKARIAELAKRSNGITGKETVKLCGWVEDMPSLLQKQDVFVGVSRAAMEAAACGCAVILAGDEGYLGILDPDSSPLALQSNFCARGCPHADEERLLCDLERLLSDPALRQKCASFGRQLILASCNAEGMCRDTLALYERSRPVPHRATVTVAGYFGCGNLGDDAILMGFCEELHRQAPDIRLLALTGHPRRDSRRFGLMAYGRKNPFSILWCLLRSDAFLCGGGSLLQNLTSHRSLSYYLTLLSVSQRLCPTLLYASGIGPLLGERAKRRCAEVLTKCRYISLRDEGSRRLLQLLEIPPDHLHQGADAVFLLSPPPLGRATAALSKNGIKTAQDYLAVILREPPAKSEITGLLPAVIRTFCQRHDLTPLFLIFDRACDRRITQRIQKRCGGKILSFCDVSEALAVISESRLTLSMRLHGLILATAAEVPALGISLDGREEKITSFCKEAGQSILAADGLSVVEAVEALELLWRDRERLRSVLRNSAAEMRKKAKKDLANIVGMIYNESK